MFSLRNIQLVLSVTIASLWVIGWGAAVFSFATV